MDVDVEVFFQAFLGTTMVLLNGRVSRLRKEHFGKDPRDG